MIRPTAPALAAPALATLALAAILLATPVSAADLTLGTVLGTTAEEITTALAADGYTVRKYEREHGYIEVKADRDGRRYEIKVDSNTGAVTAIELDD
ncbi:MAG: PepSY domain-containing protein [Alphaproteobacteria bacterium]|nr:PepSY domain-containing protein [Alphaproteobacteria bacterium]